MSSFETLAFVRGASAKYPIDYPSIQVPRRDRKPRNSEARFHDFADAWFARVFGVPYRSHGLFLTSEIGLAKPYAHSPSHILRVVPLGSYRYCWSPRVRDLLFAATELKEASKDQIEDYLSSSEYQESSLQGAFDAGHEVMLYCDRYIAVPIGLLGMVAEPASPTIILP